MPKMRTVVAKGKKPVSVQSKTKLGGRKSSQSAVTMSVTELLDVVTSAATRGGDVDKAKKELAKRGA